MSQNISLFGTNYSSVPAVLLPKQGGGTARFDDASVTTAVASNVTQGKIFLAADGTITTGTATGGGSTLITKSITANGTYNASSDNADGYSSVTVNIPGWTFVKSGELTVNTTSTSAGSAGSVTCDSSIVDKSIMIYVRIRDKAGKRAGYFCGSDNFFINYRKANGSTTADSVVARAITAYNSSNQYIQNGSGYGVYAYSITNAGVVNIYRRYNSSYSLTINGTYKIDIYKLAYPDGVSIFDI